MCLWKRLNEMLQSIFSQKFSKFFYPPKVPLKFFGVQNMSHGNGSSAFVFQVTGILKPVTDSTDKILQLSHSHMAGCNSLYGLNFDFRMTYFDAWHFRQKCQLPLSNYNARTHDIVRVQVSTPTAELQRKSL